MARTKTYHHFCPVARALEVIGEKWSLLIVRDLMRGPKRFSDLQRYLGDITAKWLSLRLRDLEQAGIVERDVRGRREVWYRLTAKGRALRPVIEELAFWGIDHALRPPLPGEPVHPAHATTPFVGYWNRRGLRPEGPVAWSLNFDPGTVYPVRFDGETWSIERGESPADLAVTVSPEAWVAFLAAPPEQRRELAGSLRMDGTPERVSEFVALMERSAESAGEQERIADLGRSR
ncbi:MAG: winged helix-turn-helix transcriptional regulator [Dehalococcoidia bacterium]